MARMEAKRNARTVLVGKPQGKKNIFEDLGIHNRVILKWISNRKDARGWTGDLAHDRNT